MSSDEIIHLICDHFNVCVGDVTGKTRKKEIVFIRHLCMYFISVNSKISLKAIGYNFGTCHSNVLRAIESVEDDFFMNKDLRKFMRHTYQQIKGHPMSSSALEKRVSLVVPRQQMISEIIKKAN